MESKFFLEERNLIILLIAVFAFFPFAVNAQTGNVTIQIVSGGNISVNVTDASTNGPLNNAAIAIREATGNETLSSGTTNSSGIFISSELLAGNYTIQTSKAGYITNTTNATVNSSLTTNVSILLQLQEEEGGGGGDEGRPGGGGGGEGEKKRKEIDIDFEKVDGHIKKLRAGDALSMRIIGPIERTETGVALIAKGGKLSFEEHLVLINDVLADKVNLTINSTPVNLLLEVATPGYVDFDNDGRADVKIVVNSIQRDTADVTFTSLRTVRVVSYPAEIFIPQGSSDLYLITVINNGVNEQKDITLAVIGAPYGVNVTPLSVEKLKKNELAIFAMSLDVPDNAIVGLDKLILKVTSNRITKEYPIELHIEENLEKSFEKREMKRIEREISNVQFVSSEIWNAALQKQLQGFDVGGVFTNLRIATTQLEEAKAALSKREFEKASGLVLKSKKHIEEAIGQANKAKISPSSVLLYAAVIGFAAFAVFAIAKYAKSIKKKIARKRELKEVEEKLEEWEKRHLIKL